MKKHIIAAAVAAAVAAPAAFAGAPTVYGQLNMSLDSLTQKNAAGTNNTDSGIFVSSNNSRIGVKGSADLGNGLKAIYKMEFAVSADVTTNGGPIKGRNAYAGLAGGFGAVLLGRHDTPTKMAEPTDTFNDGYGDNNPMAGHLGVLGKGAEIRASNVLAYVSPSFAGVKFVGALVPKEQGGNTAKKSSLTDAYSVALMYGSKKKGLYLSAGYDSFGKNYLNAANDFTQYRLAAQYTMGSLMGNVMFANYDDGASTDSTSEGTNWQVNLTYTIGAATLKGKYSAVDYKASSAKDGSAYGLGVDYALGKKTTAYIEYVATDNFNITYNGTGPNVGSNAGSSKAETSVISLGLLHKF